MESSADIPAHPARPGLLTILAKIAPFVIAGLVGLILFALFAGRAFDDPYITYRYAENLAAGRGFVYNEGERVLSTTTPLYALLLALVRLVGLDVPLTSNLIGCLALALGGLALYQIGQTLRTPYAGAALLLLYPTFPLLITTLGAETAFFLMLLLGGFLATVCAHYTMAALLLALATLTRADGVLAAGIAGLYVLIMHITALPPGTRLAGLRDRTFYTRLPWRALGFYAVMVGAWHLFAWFYFGAPFPVTLAAKRAQGQMLISRQFFGGMLAQVEQLWANPFFRPHFGLALLGLLVLLAGTLLPRVPGLKKVFGEGEPSPALPSPAGSGGVLSQRVFEESEPSPILPEKWPAWLLLLCWCILYATAYSMLGVSGYFWYYAPLVPGLLILAALGLEASARGPARILARTPAARRVWQWSISLPLTALLLWPQLGGLAGLAGYADARAAIYSRVGAWLNAHTPPEASIATLEVGIIGYHAQRRMIDFAGLIQPEVAHQMLPTSTYQDTALYAVRRYQPDYLVLQRGALPALEADPEVRSACVIETTLEDNRFSFPMDIYRCRW